MEGEIRESQPNGAEAWPTIAVVPLAYHPLPDIA
jgi:hypothetical protein